VDTAQSDFTNRPRPGISLVLAVWTYLLTGKNQYRFQVLPGKKLALDGAFQVDDVQVLGSKLLKIRILFFCDAVLP
jgi:hypothetical protein